MVVRYPVPVPTELKRHGLVSGSGSSVSLIQKVGFELADKKMDLVIKLSYRYRYGRYRYRYGTYVPICDIGTILVDTYGMVRTVSTVLIPY
jgi:hypothetical protein